MTGSTKPGDPHGAPTPSPEPIDLPDELGRLIEQRIGVDPDADAADLVIDPTAEPPPLDPANVT